jgi:hypothetical protein
MPWSQPNQAGERTMAKKSTNNQQTAPAENTSAYFRRVFHENPKLLKGRSNEELLNRWLADHPGEKEVPKSVKNGLQNVKGILRSKGRKRKAAKAAAGPIGKESSRAAPRKSHLEQLEEKTDEVLTLARSFEQEGLESIVNHLRRARNEVVWKLGE